MLGDRDEQEIEEEALLLGRLAPRDQQMEVAGEAHASHELACRSRPLTSTLSGYAWQIALTGVPASPLCIPRPSSAARLPRASLASARGASLADPMARLRSTYVCSECGGEQSRWHGRCPDCGSFATLVEQAPASDDARSGARRQGAKPGLVVPLASVETSAAARIGTGIAELDRVLGGGLVPGSLVLLGGEPGVGKSSLTAAMLGAIGAQRPVLLDGRRGVAGAGAAARRAPGRDGRRRRAGRDRARDGLRHDRGDCARGLRRRLDPDAVGRAARCRVPDRSRRCASPRRACSDWPRRGASASC